MARPPVSRTALVRTGGRRAPRRVLVARPPDLVPGTHPVLAFGHGFAQRADGYVGLLGDLAARGYLVVAPTSHAGPLPPHGGYADALWRSLVWAHEHEPAAHPTLAILAGHSLGGGVALLAAARHTGAGGPSAVVTLGATPTRPRARLERIAAPVLYVVGDRDRVVPPEVTRPLYAATPTATWAAIEGGFHCGFIDRARWNDFGCDDSEVTREVQLATTATLVGDWLDMHVRGEPARPAPAGVAFEPARAS